MREKITKYALRYTLASSLLLTGVSGYNARKAHSDFVDNPHTLAAERLYHDYVWLGDAKKALQFDPKPPNNGLPIIPNGYLARAKIAQVQEDLTINDDPRTGLDNQVVARLESVRQALPPQEQIRESPVGIPVSPDTFTAEQVALEKQRELISGLWNIEDAQVPKHRYQDFETSQTVSDLSFLALGVTGVFEFMRLLSERSKQRAR